jgi:hypothetical protein
MAEFTPQFGDFSGHGRLDLVSGSNCCDPYRIHLFPRRANGSFAERTEVYVKAKPEHKFERGTTRPHLVDWNRDGHTDLVVAHVHLWTLEIALGPLTGKKDIAFLPTRPVQLPPIPDVSPIHFSFADWDGDGRMDLLVGCSSGPQPSRYSVYWFRNTSDKGPPRFAEPVHLLDVPKPWQLHAFTAVNWGRDSRPSLVVSVTKGWKIGEDWKLGEGGKGWWPVTSELWLYRQKAEARAAPDRGGR